MRIKRLVVALVIIVVTVPCSIRNAQVNRRSTPRPSDSQYSVVLKELRGEAAEMKTAKFSKVFSAVSEKKSLAHLKLSTDQLGLVHRLEELNRDVIKGWLLRDVEQTPAPALEALQERLSERGDRLRERIIAHFEAMVVEGILSERQQRTCLEMIGRKRTPLVRGRFGPPREFEIDEMLAVEELSRMLRAQAGPYWRAGPLMNSVLGGSRLGEFLDPKTNEVPPHLVPYARPFMPAINPSKDETGLVSRLDSLTRDIFGAWLTRDLDRSPRPTKVELRRRLTEYRLIEDSLCAHADAIAIVGILSRVHATLCLRSIWRDRGMRALLDPSLAAGLRLTKSQRDTVASLLDEKDQISDAQTEAQAPLVGPSFTNPDSMKLSEHIVIDSRNHWSRWTRSFGIPSHHPNSGCCEKSWAVPGRNCGAPLPGNANGAALVRKVSH